MLFYLILTVLVGIFFIAVQRRTAYLNRRQWKLLDRPGTSAAEPLSPEPPTTTVTRVAPPAIEGRQQ